jgi:Calcineurin-like phosphoesterase
MLLQCLSDLHLESEDFAPVPAQGAEFLVLAGDIDSTWAGFERFAGWPVPVIAVAGNHEFDDRELDEAWPALRAHCSGLGIRLIEREAVVLAGRDGRRIRFVGTVRWTDFDLFGAAQRERAMRAGAYFMNVQRSRRHGAAFDAEAVRDEALGCRAWLASELARPPQGGWDATVVVTHFAPSVRSVDPRYGRQPGSASFCNADDDLLPAADLWLHGHLHCRHDYVVHHPGGRSTRVACQARGLASKGEDAGFDPAQLFAI